MPVAVLIVRHSVTNQTRRKTFPENLSDTACQRGRGCVTLPARPELPLRGGLRWLIGAHS
jgi:hypothetical protein